MGMNHSVAFLEPIYVIVFLYVLSYHVKIVWDWELNQAEIWTRKSCLYKLILDKSHENFTYIISRSEGVTSAYSWTFSSTFQLIRLEILVYGSLCSALVALMIMTPERLTDSVRYDDVIKWKHFPLHWPFVWGIRRSPVNSSHKGQWRRTWMFSLICAWINSLVNNREAGDLRRYCAHYDVIVKRLCGLSLMAYDILRDVSYIPQHMHNYASSCCENNNFDTMTTVSVKLFW